MKYIYMLNYSDNYKDLCNLEMKSIWGFIPSDKTFIATKYINPSKSVFIKGCIAIIAEEKSLEELYESIKAYHLFFNGYKIIYIKSDDDLTYKDRLKALRMIGFSIEGDFKLQNPEIELAFTKFNDKWVFGKYIRNDNAWMLRKQKPFNYSYALDIILAKTIINIAVENKYDLHVVDPCCGIGTVIIEGRFNGVDIKGFDINPNVVRKCNRNLCYFGFEGDVKNQNIKDITEHFDIAIVDLPYGKFSKTSLSEQRLIINKTRQIAKKALFVTMSEMDELFISAGFTIKDRCYVQKRDQFSRFISVCY
ncbi:MAG TPA: hypothetical protein VIK84_02470 [Haloplasmataceae bacterium]